MRKEIFMNEDQIDVTTEITDASSAENQTVETTETQSDGGDVSRESKVSETVPYERFAEVNSKSKALEEKYAKLEAELQAINSRIPQPQQTPQDLAQKQQEQLIREQLKSMGFADQEEVNKRLQQIEEDRKLENTINQLENRYDGRDGRPKFNKREILEYARDNQIGSLEAAYKLKNHDALMDYAIKTAQGRTKPVKSEVSDGSGSSEAGTTNSDLLSAVSKGDKSSLLTFIKRQMK